MEKIKKDKIQRQGLTITLHELINLKLELINEIQEAQKKLGIEDWKYIDYQQKIQLNIINKKGLSDTWEIEK